MSKTIEGYVYLYMHERQLCKRAKLEYVERVHEGSEIYLVGVEFIVVQLRC